MNFCHSSNLRALRGFVVNYSLKMQTKIEQLKAALLAQAPMVIAYSGGVDSAYLLAIAHETLGGRMLAVIADSPSLPRESLEAALALAREIGAPVEIVRTEEMSDSNYASNPFNRCYFCKAELFAKLDRLARERGFAAIAYGENADDMAQVRPGRQAATEFKVLAPLRDVGMTKAEIRAHSRHLGLPTSDAPAQPCLSSRIPHGTPVTLAALSMVERGEKIVRSFGFKVFRVRHIVENDQPRAKVQIAPEEMEGLSTSREKISQSLLELGYSAVEFDPQGYRSPA
jgi:uncharacterized protein